MIQNKLNFFFKHQIWHLGGIIVLFYIGVQLVDLDINTNTFLEISALSLVYDSNVCSYNSSGLCMDLLEI